MIYIGMIVDTAALEENFDLDAHYKERRQAISSWPGMRIIKTPLVIT